MTNKHDERVERIITESANKTARQIVDGYKSVGTGEVDDFELAGTIYDAMVKTLTTLTKEVREQTLAEVREGLKTMRPILWNDDPKRHVGNITKYNTINEVLQLLDTLENK